MLIDTVRQTIREHDLIHKGDHIILGLSGGPDSTCLFHVLLRLAGEFALTIHPVHVNHLFRPGDAERDQAYAEAISAKAGLTCHSFTVDCNALAEELGMTSEEAGRKARYDAFVQVAEEVAQTPASKAGPAPLNNGTIRIAVAQNANDQAETILHRILRGTGTDGLSGIAYQRSERGIPVIRPLLDVPRKEIEQYCEDNGLNPVIDHTNQEPIYMRNRIRLQLLPELARYNENIVETLTRMGRIAAADREYLWQQTETAYHQLKKDAGEKGTSDAGEKAEAAAPVILDRAGLAEQPDSIRHRIIAMAFGEIGLVSDISEERLRAADQIIMKKQAPKTVQFPKGYTLTVQRGEVRFAAPGQRK